MNPNQKIRNGRKFILTILLYSIIGIGFIATSLSPELVKSFEDFCETLVTVLLVYCGGNVGNKWVNKGVDFSKPKETKE
jgi:hypothetical protein